MRPPLIVLAVVALLGCATSPSRQVAEEPEVPPGVTFGGGDGSSCETRVAIHGVSGSGQGGEGLYGWLRSRYPGHQVKEQGLMECQQHMTDRMTIVTSDGRELVVYFDVSEFYGKGLP